MSQRNSEIKLDANCAAPVFEIGAQVESQARKQLGKPTEVATTGIRTPTPVSARGPPIGRLWNRMVLLRRRLEPARDSILHVYDGFHLGFAVRHAAG